MKKTAFLTILILILISFLFLPLYWNSLLAAPNKESTKKIFVINKNQATREIAKNLKDQGFIRSELAFIIYTRLKGKAQNLQAGDFKLSSDLNTAQVVEILTKGRIDQWLTIPEGWRIEEIAQRIAKEFDIPESEFLKVAKEGYMFPDTYLIPNRATAKEIAVIMKKNFDDRFNNDLRQEARKQKLTEEEIIILASVVERESKTKEERPIIAAILWKRFNEGFPLQADATIQYALGYQPEEKTWWKKNLTESDLKIDSPYNSRERLGLPPSPICNPGLDSIKAVIFPQNSPYYYYLHDSSGKVYYAQTLEEHNENIFKYLRKN